MSQKSSVPQAVSFVSRVLKRDTGMTARPAPFSRPLIRAGSVDALRTFMGGVRLFLPLFGFCEKPFGFGLLPLPSGLAASIPATSLTLRPLQ